MYAGAYYGSIGYAQIPYIVVVAILEYARSVAEPLGANNTANTIAAEPPQAYLGGFDEAIAIGQEPLEF